MKPLRAATLLPIFCALLLPPARADEIDELIRQEMSSRRIPGVALTILQRGAEKKTACYGLANLELGVPVTTNTVFEIGSVTKQFTAACILLLQQQGKLSVEDRISRHLRNTPSAWTNITVRHLLTHTSGIKNYTGLNGFEWRRHHTQEQFIRIVGEQPLDFAPGDSWRYSNSGYNLLGYIVENVSGTNYWQFQSDHIFQPLGMTETTDRNPGNIITNRASGYEQTNRNHINRDYDLTDVFSAGAIVSTLHDLAKWNAVLDSTNLLTAESKVLMWRPQTLNDGKPTKYGFGWFLESVENHHVNGHGGATSGFSASIQRLSDAELTVILLTNTDEMIATTLARKVALTYLKAK
jgi:D-alanyl-D-alanine carboxypeptidase